MGRQREKGGELEPEFAKLSLHELTVEIKVLQPLSSKDKNETFFRLQRYRKRIRVFKILKLEILKNYLLFEDTHYINTP